MYLEFAEILNSDTTQPIHISEVSAQSPQPLVCPFCQAALQPEYWDTLPHFSHANEPCRYVREYERELHISLPLYQTFKSLQLPQNSLTQHQQERIAVGELTLLEFFELQQPLVEQTFHRFQQELLTPKTDRERSYFLNDLKLFEWTRRKCDTFALHLAELPVSPPRYALGSSSQSQHGYLSSVQARFKTQQRPRPIVRLPRQSCVEWYVVHRFGLQFDTLGSFQLSEASLNTMLQELHDLRYNRSDRRQKIKAGMQRAKMLGKIIHRPKESPEQFLQKPSSQRIIPLVKQGLTQQEIFKHTGSSINTIRKVQALLNHGTLRLCSGQEHGKN